MADTLKEDDEKLSRDEYVVVEDPKKLSAVDDDDDDIDPDNPDGETGDARIAHTSDEDRDAIRERRRAEKLERKQRRDVAIVRDKTELAFLTKRNDELERRLLAQEQRAHQSDVNSLAYQAQQAQAQAEQAERVIAKAVEAGNGDDVAQALRYRDQAMQRAQQLLTAQQQTAASPPVQQVPATAAKVVELANKFIDDNKDWYDRQGRNEDSAIVLAIDAALVRDGYAPHTEEYWAELNKRVARRLPEHFTKTTRRDDHGEEPPERVSRGGPNMGSGKEHAPVSTRKEVYISPERKSALMEAGVWDDPVLRNKYVKRYIQYDKDARENRS
jgi:hypothetical protein